MAQKLLIIIVSILFVTIIAIPCAKCQWIPTNFYGGAHSFVVSGQNLFAGSQGVFRSSDNGKNWTVANSNSLNAEVISLALIDTDLFAGTANQGVFLSTNNGRNWTAVNTGLPMNTAVSALIAIGSSLFAGTDQNGVFSRQIRA